MQNLFANPKCSLLVAKDPEDRTDIVVTLYGDAVPVCKISLSSSLFGDVKTLIVEMLQAAKSSEGRS
ncbi:hypothetical protein B296_00036955 [Ensete ventricosum]|uniref:Uncharacterized protein n=1 Tax=Ensete ventricosum TaxID=4639 RepID=A0A426ZJY0_ENSVE|nr:hypothetical protein B296_00036955 [Ensete ventricosum]